MPQVQFYRGYGGNSPKGFAPVAPDNKQSDVIHSCKEVFSHRLVGYGGREGVAQSKEGTVKFLFRDQSVKFTPEFVLAKLKTLGVFEEAMGFKPAAKCNIIQDKVQAKSYLLFEVSASWRTSQPIAHILALLVRNHYHEHIWGWPEIVNWLRMTRKIQVNTSLSIIEIVANKGQIRPDVFEGNGITSYAGHRADKLWSL